MIYDRQGYHKTLVLFSLVWEVYSTGLKENHDAHCDSQHLVKVYSTDHSNCKFPEEVQPENVPVSILHQEDEARLKRLARKPDKEKQSIQSNK